VGATKLADVRDMAGPLLDFAGSCYYIYFYFSVMGPPWEFWGCHMVPTDWPTWMPSHIDVTFMSSSYMTRGGSWVVPRGVTWGCHVALFYWSTWALENPIRG
jgi:hypothetical protein